MTSDREVLVVERDKLFANGSFEGFKLKKEFDYETLILENYVFKSKEPVEKDESFKQPISYALVVNPKLKKVFVYQRASDNNYDESRLQGKWSCGVGGHIERSDSTTNPLHYSLLRELEEELGLKEDSFDKIEVLGYVNNDSDPVGRVHFGILYVVVTDLDNVSPANSEISSGNLRSLQELENICASKENRVEEWTKISLDPLKEYFENSVD